MRNSHDPSTSPPQVARPLTPLFFAVPSSAPPPPPETSSIFSEDESLSSYTLSEYDTATRDPTDDTAVHGFNPPPAAALTRKTWPRRRAVMKGEGGGDNTARGGLSTEKAAMMLKSLPEQGSLFEIESSLFVPPYSCSQSLSASFESLSRTSKTNPIRRKVKPRSKAPRTFLTAILKETSPIATKNDSGGTATKQPRQRSRTAAMSSGRARLEVLKEANRQCTEFTVVKHTGGCLLRFPANPAARVKQPAILALPLRHGNRKNTGCYQPQSNEYLQSNTRTNTN